MALTQKEENARTFVEKFRSGVAFNIGLVACLTGAALENETIFIAGAASALAFTFYQVMPAMFHPSKSPFLTFIATLLGAITPIFTFAFIERQGALYVASAFSLFLTFIASSAKVEEKTFKDGLKAILLVLVYTIISFYLGKLVTLIL